MEYIQNEASDRSDNPDQAEYKAAHQLRPYLTAVIGGERGGPAGH
jgi:hypothetical protein